MKNKKDKLILGKIMQDVRLWEQIQKIKANKAKGTQYAKNK